MESARDFKLKRLSRNLNFLACLETFSPKTKRSKLENRILRYFFFITHRVQLMIWQYLLTASTWCPLEKTGAFVFGTYPLEA